MVKTRSGDGCGGNMETTNLDSKSCYYLALLIRVRKSEYYSQFKAKDICLLSALILTHLLFIFFNFYLSSLFPSILI